MDDQEQPIVSGTVAEEFQEIGHCGGQVTFNVVTNDKGRRGYQIGYHHQRANRMGMFAVYALPQGIPVDTIQLGGIGQPWNPAPFSNCIPVFIGSDSEGRYGHQCPNCQGYWRSDSLGLYCPYCGMPGQAHDFLTLAQRRYVKQYCDRLMEALNAEKDGEHVIDMDAVADAVGKEGDKPPFYYAEQRQQNKFTCGACGHFNDILGTYCYCSICMTRNDLQELEEKTIPGIRKTINAGGPYEDCARDSVAAFDSYVGRFIKELAERIPLTARRRAQFEKRFHNLKVIAEEIRAVFDINILDGMKAEDIEFTALMFHRRHVYEHNGGEVDEKYLAESGDRSVRLRQALRETQESAHRLCNLVMKIGRNLQEGFHEIFPPNKKPIESHQGYLQRLAKAQLPRSN